MTVREVSTARRFIVRDGIDAVVVTLLHDAPLCEQCRSNQCSHCWAVMDHVIAEFERARPPTRLDALMKRPEALYARATS